MTYKCPVCGYDELTHPPQDYMICPCCNTEFGYDDFATDPEELRRRWIADGAQWQASYMSPPPNWSPIQQLENIGHVFSVEDLQAIARNRREPEGVMTYNIGTACGTSRSVDISALVIVFNPLYARSARCNWSVGA